jgi:hypothetical protein
MQWNRLKKKKKQENRQKLKLLKIRRKEISQNN